MTYGGLFEGIGGFALAAQMAAITPVWSNEIDPYCCQVLRKNFNHQIIEDDIQNIGKHNLEPTDVICGGFPCQPFSYSGKRKGTNDNRYLWPEMFRIIREIRPRWVIGENVPGILNMEDGQIFERICLDLEGEGYKVETLVLPACGVGAIHRRNRVWIVANASSQPARMEEHRSCRQEREPSNTSQSKMVSQGNGQVGTEGIGSTCENGNAPNSNCTRLGTWGELLECIQQKLSAIKRSYDLPYWGKVPEPTISGVDDGIPHRVDRIKALGNAIHPGVAYEIFRIILEYEYINQSQHEDNITSS